MPLEGSRCTNSTFTGPPQWRYGVGKTSTNTGQPRDGQYHGQWVERFADGTVQEGIYVENKRHAQWVIREVGR